MFSSMRYRLLSLTALAAGLVPLPLVNAQVVVQGVRLSPSISTVPAASPAVSPPAGAVIQEMVNGVPLPVAAPNVAAGGVKTEQQERLEMLLKAKVDRTPEGILKAWKQRNEPEQEPTKTESEEVEEPVTLEVTVASVKGMQLEVTSDSIDGVQPAMQFSAKIGEQEVPQTFRVLKLEGDASPKKIQLMLVPSPAAVPAEGVPALPGAVPANPAGAPQNATDPAQQNPADALASKFSVGTQVTLTEFDPAAAALAQTKRLQEEVDRFSEMVTLGDWQGIGDYLKQLESVDEADRVYDHLLRALVTAMPSSTPQRAAQQRSQMQSQGKTPPTSVLTPEDLLQLTEASPKTISVVTPADDEKKNQDAAKTVADATASNPEAGSAVTKRMAATPGLPIAATPIVRPTVTIARPVGGTITVPSGVNLSSLPAGLQTQLLEGGVSPVGAATPTGPVLKPSHHLSSLAQLIRSSRTAGYDFADFVEQLEKGTRHFGGTDAEKRLTAASLLLSSGMLDESEQFLPKLAESGNDLDVLKQWATFSTQKYASKKLAKWLDIGWKVNQEIVAAPDAPQPDRDRALTRLITLSTQVDAEVGEAWLKESFTESPERGIAILANLGTQSATYSRSAAQTPETTRLKMLRLQTEAVETLLKVAPEAAAEMQSTLTILAQNWIAESNTSIKYSTQTTRNASMQIDMYGNFYWADPNQMNRFNTNSRRPRPIKIGDVLELVPSEAWQQLIQPTLLTEIQKLTANLHLRLNEEDKAFPHIEALAPKHPEMARDLVHEFLRIWTRNHDPNTDRQQRNPYIYMYGFDQKADSIPLTRSKQERNLAELTHWVGRIRELPIEDVDESLLANAFTTCHSNAEVYQLEKVKGVFGDLTKLKPETIAGISQKMRTSLSSNWRDIRNQEAKQTNRKKPEVEKEVQRGYQVATAMIQEALTAAPDNWKLNLALACIQYDENAYSQSLQKSSEFSDRRDRAFEQFALAAQKYIDVSKDLEENKQSTEVFDLWFYASLGAVDLGKITAKTQPDLKQYARIRQSIESMSEALAQEHMSRFANNLFTRMSPIKPELKFRYLRAGFEIVGDHPRAWEAKKLFDYYQDLVNEIQLQVELDGDDRVGTDAFGLYVSLRHTPEIERESGGFGKYVQNQNNMMYSFNYGRPTEDYRDKFEDNITQALAEHFEVLNVTFEGADTMRSRPASNGWRVTPFAYVLVKSRGSQVDRLPPMKLDLDFLDTSGYVVIPIESPALVIDSLSKPTPRPIKDLKVTETLDERQSGDGKLILEVSASGKGLIPNLEEIVDLKQENLEVVSIDDQGSLPTTFDSESDEIQILSDRSWTVEYQPKDTAGSVTEFAFAPVNRENVDIKFQRYEDADLVAADDVIQLQSNYAGQGGTQMLLLIGLPLLALALVGLAIVIALNRKPAEDTVQGFAVPEDVNPFTVLSLLKDIQHRNGISEKQGQELQASINRVESYYFGDSQEQPPEDLERLAENWVSKARVS